MFVSNNLELNVLTLLSCLVATLYTTVNSKISTVFYTSALAALTPALRE